jgi:hypothetical protein
VAERCCDLPPPPLNAPPLGIRPSLRGIRLPPYLIDDDAEATTERFLPTCWELTTWYIEPERKIRIKNADAWIDSFICRIIRTCFFSTLRYFF